MKIISKYKDFYDYLVGIYGEDEKLVYDRRLNFYQNPTIACPKFIGFEQQYPDKKYAWHSLLWIGAELVHLFVTNTGEVYTSFDVVDIDELFANIHDRDGAELTLKTGETLHFFTQFGKQEIFQHHQLLKQHGFLPREQSPIFQVIFRECFTPDYIRYYNNSLYKANIAIESTPILLFYARNDNIRIGIKLTNGYSSRQYLRHKILVDGKLTKNYQHDFHVFINPNLQSLGVFFDPVFVWQNISEYLGRLRTEQETSPPMTDNDKIMSKGFDNKRSFRPKMKK